MKKGDENKFEIMYKTAGKELADKIVSVFEGDENKAENWYCSSCVALENLSPKECCKAKKYFQVEKELGRIEHGIFS